MGSVRWACKHLPTRSPAVTPHLRAGMASWLSDIASRAEQLLESVDQAAAKQLHADTHGARDDAHAGVEGRPPVWAISQRMLSCLQKS
jgi:hypothetical protein